MTPSVKRTDRSLIAEGDCQQELLEILLELLTGHFAMLVACLDESAGKSSIFAVCGVLYDRKSVDRVDKLWKKELELAGIRHFHAVEAAHFRGEFEGKSTEFRDALHRKLIGILNKHVSGLVTVCTI